MKASHLHLFDIPNPTYRRRSYRRETEPKISNPIPNIQLVIGLFRHFPLVHAHQSCLWRSDD